MSRQGLIGISIAALALAAALVILFAFNPQQYSFYPRCALKSLTGWDCPGCGGLRAMHQMLNGNFGQAFSLNPFLFLLLPILGLLGLNQLISSVRGRPLFPWKYSSYFVGTLLVVSIAFVLIRNL